MELKLGETVALTGNVSTLEWIKPGYERETEAALGYHPGRLAQGYKIALLTRMPRPQDFEFDGTTLRSGGRLGPPLANNAADQARIRVHDQILADRGQDGYRALQEWALRNVTLRGDQRIAKVLPTLRHSGAMTPDAQYPMGGGGLQWKIAGPLGLPFLIAVEVGTDGVARTPGFSVDLARGGYDARAKLRTYMMNA
jgi:hypothetical protein